MEIGSRLRKRWYLVILAAIIALLVGATAVFKISHKGLKVNRTVYRVGIGQLLVDTNPSQLTNITGGAGALGGRAALIAQYSTGPQVVDQIAKLAGVPLASLTVEAQTTSATKTGGSASKNLGTVGAGTETVLLRTSGQAQTITITSQAKKSPLAKSLVTATMRAMTRSLRHLQNSEAFNHPAPVTTSSSTTTTSTSTTAAAGGKAKSGKGTGAAANASAAARAAARTAAHAQAAASQKARQIQQSKLVLRRLGAVRVTKVVIGASKSKAIGYTIGAFVVLLLLILGLDALLRGRRTGPTPSPGVSGGLTAEMPVAGPAEERRQLPAETPAPEPSARD